MNQLTSKFQTIVADPPWQYGNETLWQRPVSRPDSHYKTLTIDEIKSLPVAEVTDKNCALWLWTPTHHLIRGIAYEVCEAWGFKPMTTLIWCKPQMGLGHYIRNAHEPCLLAVKGSYQLKVKDQMSWFMADRTTHSKKPARFYRIIEAISHEPRLELFSRTPKDGWTVWGNEMHDPLGWGYDPEGWKI